MQDILIDTYITPHEINTGGTGIQQKVLLLVQQFASDIVQHHLCHFTSCCHLEGLPDVQRPHSFMFNVQHKQITNTILASGKKFFVEGSNYLPPFESPDMGYIHIHCTTPGTLASNITAHRIVSRHQGVPQSSSPSSARIREIVCIAMEETKPEGNKSSSPSDIVTDDGLALPAAPSGM